MLTGLSFRLRLFWSFEFCISDLFRISRCGFRISFLHRGLPLLPDLLDHVAAGEAVEPGPGRDQAGVDLFVAQRRLAAGPAGGDRRLQPLAIVGLEMIAPGLRLAEPLGRLGGRELASRRTRACNAAPRDSSRAMAPCRIALATGNMSSRARAKAPSGWPRCWCRRSSSGRPAFAARRPWRRSLHLVVVADDGRRLGHHLPELGVDF